MCASGSSGAVIVIGGILLLSSIVFLLTTKYLLAGDSAAGAALADGEATVINCVLSFGAAAGGLQFAEALKDSIVTRTGWEDSSIYLDCDALKGKDGTESKSVITGEGDRTAYLNPGWASYYQVSSPPNYQLQCSAPCSGQRPRNTRTSIRYQSQG